jgi:hypothetical protein
VGYCWLHGGRRPDYCWDGAAVLGQGIMPKYLARPRR